MTYLAPRFKPWIPRAAFDAAGAWLGTVPLPDAVNPPCPSCGETNVSIAQEWDYGWLCENDTCQLNDPDWPEYTAGWFDLEMLEMTA